MVSGTVNSQGQPRGAPRPNIVRARQWLKQLSEIAEPAPYSEENGS